MKYIVTYDIANDKNRSKLSDMLEAYGSRVNYSVFEIELSEAKRDNLLAEIEIKKLIDTKYDSLRFYHLCENCVPKSFEFCRRQDPFEAVDMYI